MTYQSRWLLAQALGTGVETAGGSSGSYGDPVQETAPAQQEPLFKADEVLFPNLERLKYFAIGAAAVGAITLLVRYAGK